MKKIIVLFFCFAFVLKSNSQITKDNWMVGGNGTFTYKKFKTTADDQKVKDISISPNIGYFFIDNFATGVKVGFEYYQSRTVFGEVSDKIYEIGPFLRYYLLSHENSYNLLLEGDYKYALTKTNTTTLKQNSFSFFAGPVLFLNNVVGLELLLGYSTASYIDNVDTENSFRIAIGLQIHLEKDNY